MGCTRIIPAFGSRPEGPLTGFIIHSFPHVSKIGGIRTILLQNKTVRNSPYCSLFQFSTDTRPPRQIPQTLLLSVFALLTAADTHVRYGNNLSALNYLRRSGNIFPLHNYLVNLEKYIFMILPEKSGRCLELGQTGRPPAKTLNAAQESVTAIRWRMRIAKMKMELQSNKKTVTKNFCAWKPIH